MKKLLALLLAILMVTALFGCGKSPAANNDDLEVKDTSNETEATSEEIETTEPATETTETTEPAPETTEPAPETTEPVTEAETAAPVKELSRGTIDGAVYKNEYVGFTFTRPDTWIYSTDEEIAASMNLAVDMLAADKYKETLKNSPSIYDMMVVDGITRTNLSVMYENLKLSNASNITEEQYADILEAQIALVYPEGMFTFSDELEKVKLGEVEFTKCVCDVNMMGVNMTQAYYLRKFDGYMVAVIVAVNEGYTLADIEAMFS